MIVLAIPDLHAPWIHPDALDFTRDLARDIKPDVVVFLGDEVDAAAWSRFPRDPDMPGAAQELEDAIEALKPFYRLFPKALICESNHTLRPLKRALEAGVPKAFFRTLREVLEAPSGWKWAHRHVLDGVVYVHGEGYSGQNAAMKCAMHHRRSTVIGHIHSWAGIQYSAGPCDQIWGFNSGCLIDVSAPAFAYGRHLGNKPVLGCGAVIDGEPHFYPMR